jgi:hypothetical protein
VEAGICGEVDQIKKTGLSLRVRVWLGRGWLFWEVQKGAEAAHREGDIASYQLRADTAVLLKDSKQKR